MDEKICRNTNFILLFIIIITIIIIIIITMLSRTMMMFIATIIVASCWLPVGTSSLPCHGARSYRSNKPEHSAIHCNAQIQILTQIQIQIHIQIQILQQRINFRCTALYMKYCKVASSLQVAH